MASLLPNLVAGFPVLITGSILQPYLSYKRLTWPQAENFCREWGTVSAEYIWKMDTFSNYSVSSVQSGIVYQLKDAEDASADDISLFAGIQIMNDVIRFSVRDRYSGTYTLSDELFNGSTINLTDYQVLRVELDDNSNVTTSLNGEEQLSTVDVSAPDRVLSVSNRCF